jgi:hypothetical protein
MAGTAADTKLVIEIKNKQPVELTDLTLSLLVLSQQFQRYAAQQEEDYTKEESKLYIREIRPGSIIAELGSYVASHHKEIVDVSRSAMAVLGFAKQLKKDLTELQNGATPSRDLATKDLKDLGKIVEVTAKDPGSTFNIHADNGATVNVTLNISSLEANAIQNRAAKVIEARKEPEQTVFHRVLMYWHSASKGKSRKASDKAIIEQVTSRPLSVVIEDDEIKRQMLSGKNNPFLIGFLVDVEVMYVRGEPKVYKITGLYETLEEDHPDDDE